MPSRVIPGFGVQSQDPRVPIGTPTPDMFSSRNIGQALMALAGLPGVGSLLAGRGAPGAAASGVPGTPMAVGPEGVGTASDPTGAMRDIGATGSPGTAAAGSLDIGATQGGFPSVGDALTVTGTRGPLREPLTGFAEGIVAPGPTGAPTTPDPRDPNRAIPVDPNNPISGVQAPAAPTAQRVGTPGARRASAIANPDAVRRALVASSGQPVDFLRLLEAVSEGGA